ncbi:MAG: hypothetical protein HYR84_04900 [Planctomycetes bacterium]|nr:hypothetical protein [Planctomycetota bacterium]
MNLRRWISILLLFTMIAGCGNPWSSGDRVLVSKLPHGNGLAGPHRYEVVVFKFPNRPIENHSPTNYIKRLLGLPGELLAIFFGRVFRWTPPAGGTAPFNDEGVDAKNLWKKDYLHHNEKPLAYLEPGYANREEAQKTADWKEWFEKGHFEILRKPPHVMYSMRRIVYDNDFQAKDMTHLLRWKPEAKSAWKSDDNTGFTNDGQADGQVDWMHYQHLVRPDGVLAGAADVKPKLITDSLAYNNFKYVDLMNDQGRIRRGAPRDRADDSPDWIPHWVGDLMIECNVEVVQAKGEFWLELNKGAFRYQARFDLASGQCALKSIDMAGKEKDLGTAATTVKGPGNYLLRLANMDARLVVWVDSALPFGDGVDYPPPEIRGPGEKIADVKARRGPTDNDLTPASLGNKGAAMKVTHLRLWRDTYYTTSATADRRDPDYTRKPASYSDSSDWEPLRTPNFSTWYVQPGHYLCLGDNSAASSDSRDWGLVPERLMLGRALVIYWPLDRIGRIR